MKFRHLIALAVCLALAGGQPALAQKPGGVSGGAEEVVLQVCNNTRDSAQVAVSYQPIGNGQFYNEGWFNVAPNSCREIIRTANAYIYGYAEVDGSDDSVWQGDHPLCVEYPGPYAFWTTPSTYCEAHQELRNFVVMHADNFGVFTWNLDY